MTVFQFKSENWWCWLQIEFIIYTKVVCDNLLIILWPVNWKQVQLLHFLHKEIAANS